ncbi:MAG: hypothetical protein J7L07_03780 [Candidatus Odinarchaeota archaeon]|nr:hypothetical protein [Candidatus Odinarchaeota archaeon]
MKHVVIKEILKVGKKGEIYTSKRIRKIAGLKAPGEVIAIAKEGELIIKTLKSIKEFLSEPPLMKISVEEAEKISEEAQKEFFEHGKKV